MSFQAMTWAVEKELPAMQKIVLLMMANRTNHDTGLCFPSHDRLAVECGMSKRSIVYQIEKLESAELLSVIRSTNNKGGNNPNRYKLNLKDNARAALPLVQELHYPSATVASETVIEPKRTITTVNSDFLSFDGLTAEQADCYEWAKHHDYWNFTAGNLHKFLKLFTSEKADGLKSQFDAHKKALTDGLGQTGQTGNTNAKNITGGNYATSTSKSNKHNDFTKAGYYENGGFNADGSF